MAFVDEEQWAVVFTFHARGKSAKQGIFFVNLVEGLIFSIS